VDGEREILDDEPDLAGIDILGAEVREHLDVEAPAERTFEVHEHDQRHRRIVTPERERVGHGNRNGLAGLGTYPPARRRRSATLRA
jgi:hypothetical protein